MWLFDLQNIAGLLGSLADAFASALIAIYYGFLSFPTGFAYLTGAILAGIWGLSTPISYQAESIVLVGEMGKDFRERLSIIVIGGVIMTILGILGLLDSIVNFIGSDILSGMMAGVGILLAKTGLNLIKEDKIPGIVALITSIIIYVLTKNLAYMIVTSLFLASITYIIMSKKNKNISNNEEPIKQFYEDKNTKRISNKLIFFKPILNSKSIWKAALALSALQIGANISYGAITSDIAKTSFSADKLTIMSGLADISSALFGGAPMESVISPTATGANPIGLGVVFMLIMAIVLFTGLIKKVSKLVPVSGAAGYLFVLGTFIVVPDNLPLIYSQTNSISGIVTMVITSLSDPFIGMVSGLLCKFIGL